MSTVQGSWRGPNIVRDGLVLYLDAGSPNSFPLVNQSTTWKDISGNANNGTLTNGPTFNSANGGGIVLDGVNDYIDSTFVNPFAETVMVWVKSNTTNWNENGWISSSRRQNGHIIHPNISTKTVAFYVSNSSGGAVIIGSTTLTDITLPHLYCFTTNGSNSHKIYIDDTFISENTTSITRTLTPTSQTWYIGRDDTTSRYGNGAFYNVLRYNRALSSQEILQNFNATRARFGI
jgi:hypothetical protein